MLTLPILSSRFFEDHRPDQGFFSKWRSFYVWNEKIVPVYEWQDVLYVACLVPPGQFPDCSHKVVFVLAQASALQELWLNYSTQNFSSFSEPVPNEIPSLEGLPISEAPGTLLELEPPITLIEPSADLLSNEEPIESTESLTPGLEDSDAPEGLALGALAFPPSPKEGLEEAKATGDLFEDLQREISSDSAPSSSSDPEEELLELNLEPAPLPTRSNVRPRQTSQLQPLADQTSLRLRHSSVSAENRPPALDPASPPEVRASPARTEVLVASATPPLEEVTQISVKSLVSTPAGKLDAWLEDVFSEMKKGFLKSMVLIKEGDKIKPWKWDRDFQPASTAPAAVSLQTPSPFRIVFRTHKPYHGYVVANELNEEFFAQWNASVIPEHLTLTPLIVHEHVIGMLLAIGTPASNSKGNLHLAEAVANGMALQIQKRPDAFKAA
jgi:hypothetical protein